MTCHSHLSQIFSEGFQFMVPSLYLSWSTKEQQKKRGHDFARCTGPRDPPNLFIWALLSMYAWEIKILCEEIGIIPGFSINTNKMLHGTARTPHGYTLISHTFSTHFYWLCLQPHIKTHQSSQHRLMKASAETAAFHMWFKLMSHPECLTLAGHAAF